MQFSVIERLNQTLVKKNQTITYRSLKNFEVNRFLNDLNFVPWIIIEQFDEVDDMVSIWSTLLLEVLDRHAPIKSHRIKKKYQPDWLTPEIMDLMKERNKCKINGHMDAYKHLDPIKFQNKLKLQKRICISQTLKYLSSLEQIVKQIQVNQI